MSYKTYNLKLDKETYIKLSEIKLVIEKKRKLSEKKKTINEIICDAIKAYNP